MIINIQSFKIAVLRAACRNQGVCLLSAQNVELEHSSLAHGRRFSSAAHVHARAPRGSNDHVKHSTRSKPGLSPEATKENPLKEKNPSSRLSRSGTTPTPTRQPKSLAQARRTTQQPKSTLIKRLRHLQYNERGAKKPAWKAFGDVIFVCLDCEAAEFDSQKVTEVGVATLDTRDLRDVPPGHNGATWSAKIESFHAVIAEHAHFKNRFCPSCPDKFMFGETSTIKLRQAAAWTRSFFLYSKNNAILSRDIVLVGHALQNEKRFCQTFGLELEKIEPLVDQFDTSTMLRHDGKALLGLSRLLKGLGIATNHLHNAGNDATYTLQALVALATYGPEEHKQLLQRLAPPKPVMQGEVQHEGAEKETLLVNQAELVQILPGDYTLANSSETPENKHEPKDTSLPQSVKETRPIQLVAADHE